MNPSDLEKALNDLGNKVAGGASMVPMILRRIDGIVPDAAPAQAEMDWMLRRRRFMRITITSGIAACLLAAAGLVFFTQNGRLASAAEELQQAVEAGSAYKGWIHIATEAAPGMKAPPGAPEMAKRVTQHIHTVDGSMAEVRESATGTEITLYVPATHEMVSYSSQKGEVRLGTLQEETAKFLKENRAPATVGDLLGMIKKTMGRDPVSVKETAEGDLKRFDIVFFASDEEFEKFRKEQDSGLSARQLSVWVNQDKLMTRMKFDEPGGPVDAKITYGPPSIHDIYDLGAPRTAKVIDDRLKNDLKVLMARLDERPLKGLGDYVALLASYGRDAAGKNSPDYGYVTLFATKGEKWLANEYRLVSRRAGPEVVLKELPVDWPAPDIGTLLPALFGAMSTQYFIMDGDHGWAGWYREGAHPYPDARLVTAKERNILLADMALGGQLWPNSFKNSIGSPGTSAELLKEEAHADLIGLHTKREPSRQNGLESTIDIIWWIDPAKDDLPREIFSTITIPGQVKPETETRTVYEKFAQLPNGRWYPVQWREERIHRVARTSQEEKSTSYSQLQIVPTLKLEDKWFTDPRGRLPATAPAALP